MLFQTQFFLALFIAWVIEIPVLFGLIRIVYQNNTLSWRRIIFVGLLSSALTLPYLWFVLPPYVNLAYYTFIGETLVIIVEAIILNQILGLQPKSAVICSVAINIASYALGIFLL